MKRINLFLIAIAGWISISAQSNSLLNVESYKLENGFTVFLNEDTTTTKVFGAVMVNAGAKQEDPTATGMAHYLEHMLFKGTDELGTWNFEAEKPHLDSVNLLYENLAAATTEEEKSIIQQEINEQAIKASEYGLPNEFDKLLKSIGSTGVNAFTNYEMTFYHNSFPPHEINKWLDIYSERFESPIFRSFQSELEVVYEEKNRAEDSFERRVFEKMSSLIFPDLPYGQWSVLGTTEHLKTPSLTKMYGFYEKHYVPGNMALILSGNIDKDEVKAMIEMKFGDWAVQPVPVTNLPAPTPIQGEQLEKVRITPVKAGFLGFQTVPYQHPDRYAMDVCEYILYNEGETGLINQLELNNDMIYAGAFNFTYNDAGAMVIFFVPKILIQSIGNAEKKVESALNQLREGTFSEEMLQAAKNEISRTFQSNLEDTEQRGILIGGAFNAGITWEEVLEYPEKVQSITRDDIIRVSNKYLGDNRVKMVSRTGFPKKNKLTKPPYKPVVAEQEKESSYAEEFENISSKPFEPKFLDFENDIDRANATGGHPIVTAYNPINDLFELEIQFRKGTIHDPKTEYIAGIGTLSGAGSYKLNELKNAFAALGTNYSVNATTNHFNIDLSGPDRNLSEALQLVNLLITDIQPNDNSLKVLYNAEKTDRKLEKRTPSSMSGALFNYASYGDHSYYKRRYSMKQIKKLEAEELKRDFTELTQNQLAEVTYTGTRSAKELAKLIDEHLSLSKNPESEELQVRDMESVNKTQIYFVNDKKAVQSQVYFYMPGPPVLKEEYTHHNAFNKYFGDGFSGLVLQEIREYRSLAYSAGGIYQTTPLPGTESRLLTYIGCQADKTVDAIGVMQSLVEDMPTKPERVPALRKSLQLETVTDYPDFRNIPSAITNLEIKGYSEDPNRVAFEAYEEISMDDIYRFYESRIKGKPYIITVYGDGKSINLDELKKLGEVVELDYKDFFVK